jgi:hypothetical protein
MAGGFVATDVDATIDMMVKIAGSHVRRCEVSLLANCWQF